MAEDAIAAKFLADPVRAVGRRALTARWRCGSRYVHGESGLGGLMDDYRITADGRLMLHKHIREWRDDPEASLGGYLESVRDWWVELADVHGDIRIYHY